MGKSDGGPTACQDIFSVLNTGASANASAGSVNAAAATPPTPFAAPTINRLRVIVSPSNAPGMLRSSVYLDLSARRRSGTTSGVCGRRIEQRATGYRQQSDDRHERPQPIAVAPCSQ